MASASNAVIGFNVRPDRKSAEVAEREGVEIRLHSIIYELREEIEKAMYGLLDPVFKENYAGKAEVLNVFKITKVGQIAGCRVTDGIITRTAQVRVMREGVEVWRGKIGSLKRFKDDVSEVRQGVECGIDLNGFKDIRVGDVIESFYNGKAGRRAGTELDCRAQGGEGSGGCGKRRGRGCGDGERVNRYKAPGARYGGLGHPSLSLPLQAYKTSGSPTDRILAVL